MAAGQGQGLSSEDFRKRAQLATVKVLPPGVQAAPDDPLDRALSDKRKAIAIAAYDQTQTTIETDKLRGEVEQLKLEKEKRELTAAIPVDAAQASGGDRMQEFLIAQVQGLQEQVLDARNHAQAVEVQRLSDKLSMVTDELERRGTPSESPQDQTEAVLALVERSKKIVALVTPEPAPPMAYDASFEKYRLQVEFDREIRRIEAEERRWERMQELDLKREDREVERAQQQKKVDLEARFMEQTAPRAIAIVEQFVGALVQRWMVSAPAAAAQTPPPASPAVEPEVAAPAQPPANLPPGVGQMTCTNCGASILYKSHYPAIMCSRCGMEYTNDFGVQEGGDLQTVVSAGLNGYHDTEDAFPEGGLQN